MEFKSERCPSPTNSMLEAEWQRSIGNPDHAFGISSPSTDFGDSGDPQEAFDNFQQPPVQWNSIEGQQTIALHEALSPGMSDTACSDFGPSFAGAPYFNWNGSDPFSLPQSPAVKTANLFDTHRRSVSEPPGQLAHADDILPKPKSQITFHRNGQHLGETRRPNLRATRSATKAEPNRPRPRSEASSGRSFIGGVAITRLSTPPTSAPVRHYHPYAHSRLPQTRAAYQIPGYMAQPKEHPVVRPSTRVCTPQPQIDPQLYDMSTTQLKMSTPPIPALKSAPMVVVTPQELALLIKHAVDEALERWGSKDKAARGAQEDSIVGKGIDVSEYASMDHLIDFEGFVKAESNGL